MFLSNIESTGPPLASPGDYLMGTLVFKVNPGTPNGTYTFFTTDGASGGRFTEANSFVSGTTTGFAIPQQSFTITVVPEPGTWSLLGLGGIGSFGLTWLRARRRSA